MIFINKFVVKKDYFEEPILFIPQFNFYKKLYLDNNLSIVMKGDYDFSNPFNNLIMMCTDAEVSFNSFVPNDSFFVYYKKNVYKYVVKDIYYSDMDTTLIKKDLNKNSITIIFYNKDMCNCVIVQGYLIFYNRF